MFQINIVFLRESRLKPVLRHELLRPQSNISRYGTLGKYMKIPLLNFYITNRLGLCWGCSNSLCHCLASPSESAGRMAQRHGPAFLQKLGRVQPPPLPPWLNYHTVSSITLWSKASTGWRETSLMHTQPVLQQMHHPSSSPVALQPKKLHAFAAYRHHTSKPQKMCTWCVSLSRCQVTKVYWIYIYIYICHLYMHTHNKHVRYANSIKIHMQYSTDAYTNSYSIFIFNIIWRSVHICNP